MSTPVKYTFGQYEFDLVNYILTRQGTPLSVTRKRLDVLLILVEHAGQVIRKEDLLDKVWPDQPVEEGNLTQHIFFLRRLFGDGPGTSSYILTVPGIGYLFHPAVTVIYDNGLSESMGDVKASPPSLELPGPDDKNSGEVLVPPNLSKPKGWLYSSPYRLVLFLTFFLLTIYIGYIGYVGVLMWQKADWWRPRLHAPAVQPIVTIPGMKGDLRFSRDGRYLAFTSETDTVDNRNLFVKSIDGQEQIQLTKHPYTDHSITWSPDNSRIAFMREGQLSDRKNQLLIIPANGGNEQVIGSAWGGLDWSPDGQSLAISDSDGPGYPTGIYILSLSTLRRRAISNPNQKDNLYDGDPKYSPDGRQIAFARWNSSSSGDIFIIDLASGSSRQITFDRCRLSSIQWTADGNELLFVSNRTGNLRVWRVSARGGQPIPVIGPLGEVDKIATVGNAANERLLAYTRRFEDTNILINKIMGSAPTGDGTSNCTINSTLADHSPQFSPDGTRLVFISARSGHEEVWIANANCTNVSPLTNFKGNGVGSPRWSPDGHRIVFDRHIQEQSEIFSIDLNTREIKQLTNDPSQDFLPAWSYDGQEIFFCSERGMASEIWKMRTDGSNPTQVTRYGGRESWATPDGRQIYYTSYGTIWVKSLVTGAEQRVNELQGIPINRYWTLFGTGIYYLTRETQSRSKIFRLDILTRQTELIQEFPGSPARFVPGFSISPTESRIAISLTTYIPSDISLIRDWN